MRGGIGRTAAAAWYVLVFCVLTIAGPTRARAQIALDQFKPAPLLSDGFALSRPEVLPHRRWSAMAMLDYANDPLVYEFNTGKQVTLVAHHLVLHTSLAVGLGSRFTVFAGLPIHLLMTGDDRGADIIDLPKSDGPGLGDIALGGRALLLGDATERVAISGELILRLPTAELANSSQTYSGESIGSYEGALVGELHFKRVDLRARGGLRLRKTAQIGNLDVAEEILWGYGARVIATPELHVHGEMYGASNFSALSKLELTPFEMLLGGKYIRGDWYYGAAAGPGLIAGYGSPDARVLATAGYVSEVPEIEITPDKDSDGDGLLDPVDRCPLDPEDRDDFEDEEGCSDPDNDQDGILDTADKCPLDPEDRDGFEDIEGCSDPDNDQDGILDPADECPVDPEDRDGFEDIEGCADPDNDQDGILDRDDACPLQAEDRDGFEDIEGCADPDNDQDGVLDTDDKCVLVPGLVDENGCPAAEPILLRVEFATSKDIIPPDSIPRVERVKGQLEAFPQISKLRVEGHADSRGRADMNMALSQARARSVAAWLIENGIAIDRLEAYGCGEARPRATNETEQGRQLNRRVEFHLIAPSPKKKTHADGCTETDIASPPPPAAQAP